MAVLAIRAIFIFFVFSLIFFRGEARAPGPPPRTPMSTESTPLKRSPKTLLQVISWAVSNAVRNLVQIRPWGLLEKWVKYNEYVYLNTFFRELTYRSDPSNKFTLGGSNDADSRNGLIFFWGGGSLILFLILGVKSPKSHFRGHKKLLNKRPQTNTGCSPLRCPFRFRQESPFLDVNESKSSK